MYWHVVTTYLATTLATWILCLIPAAASFQPINRVVLFCARSATHCCDAERVVKPRAFGPYEINHHDAVVESVTKKCGSPDVQGRYDDATQVWTSTITLNSEHHGFDECCANTGKKWISCRQHYYNIDRYYSSGFRPLDPRRDRKASIIPLSCEGTKARELEESLGKPMSRWTTTDWNKFSPPPRPPPKKPPPKKPPPKKPPPKKPPPRRPTPRKPTTTKPTTTKPPKTKSPKPTAAPAPQPMIA